MSSWPAGGMACQVKHKASAATPAFSRQVHSQQPPHTFSHSSSSACWVSRCFSSPSLLQHATQLRATTKSSSTARTAAAAAGQQRAT